jgi:hypothetical protein
MTIHRYTMLIEKPTQIQTEGLSRHEKLNLLKRHSADVRARLEKWLTEKRLNQQVERIEPETMFNVLFIDATENIGEILTEFPESIEVGEDKELVVETYSAAF